MKEEDDILISRYLAEELDDKNKTALEARLAEEPTLATELEQRRHELTFLRTEASLPDLKSRMQELGSQHFKESLGNTTTDQTASPQHPATNTAKQEATVRRLRWKRWAPAVGIAAAVALVLLIWNPFATAAPYEQFAQYDPVYLTEKSSDAAAAAAPAEAAFNAGHYSEAYKQLTNYLTQRPDDNEARLALGISALETNREAEAETIFADIAAGSSALNDDAQFYLALTYFKIEDPRAKATLLSIDKKNPDYGVRVTEMLQLLE